MRRLLAVTLLATLVLGHPVQGRAQTEYVRARTEHTQAGEAGLALEAAGLNLFYLPAKSIVAIGGLVLGGLAGLLTAGDMRSAYAVWVPAASGTYLLTIAHLEGSEPIEFFGSDYADEPSTLEAGGAIYDAQYSSR
jgi:hypothetical protein